MIGYVLINAWQFKPSYPAGFPKIVWKYTLNPNAGKTHLQTNNTTQLCLGDTPEIDNWWGTRQKCNNFSMSVDEVGVWKLVLAKRDAVKHYVYWMKIPIIKRINTVIE